MSKNEELKEVAKPLVDYIRKKYHPHAIVIVDSMHAEVLEGAEVVKFEWESGMAEKEAIEYLSNKYLVVGSPVNPPKEECEKHNAVLDMAIQALNKQIPKKTINKYVGFSETLFTCPTCGRKQAMMYEQYHCKECGQKLDWD